MTSNTNPQPTTTEVFEALRLSDDFEKPASGIKKPLNPTFTKLSQHRFSRVHPEDEYKIRVAIVTDKGAGGESYIVVPHLTSLFGRLVTPKVLRLAVDNAAIPRLIAEPILELNKRSNSWNESYFRAIQMAEEVWVRVEANMEAGQYECIVSREDLGPPQWPKQTMGDLVMDCFKGRIISEEDHPLILQLQGRI